MFPIWKGKTETTTLARIRASSDPELPVQLYPATVSVHSPLGVTLQKEKENEGKGRGGNA